MEEIRAFVGHSFSADDKSVIQDFIDHFRTLKKAYPNFDWDHAEEAEPVTLTQKVLEKIEGKNVFIGICTRQEPVVAPDGLKKVWYSQSLRVNATDVAFKTSDWLIQEIGLAVGRDMSIILFLEEGVRSPGGLYGNIEYISFNREHPHDSFDKLLQMLSTLTPKVEALGMAAEAEPAAEKDEKKPPADEDREPKPDWTEENYQRAAFSVILIDDEEGLKKIDEAYRASKFAQGDALPIWEAQLEYYRLLFDKRGSLQRVEELAEAHPTSGGVFQFLAKSYEAIEEYEKAAQAFTMAANSADSDKRKAGSLMSAAINYQKAGDTVRGRAFSEEAKAVTAAQSVRSDLLPKLRLFAELEKNEDVQIAFLEEIVAQGPTDTRSRFSLAFKHSESDNEDMALHHYLRIPHSHRDAATWNNLGVFFGNFGMTVKSVAAYRMAAERNETIAMSNLGFKLLHAGFIDEAREECDKALQNPERHKNIGRLLERLNDVPDEEARKLVETQEKLRSKAAFYRKLGESAAAVALAFPSGNWSAPDGILTVTVKGSTVRMSGKFEQSTSALVGLFFGSSGNTQRTHTVKIDFQVEFRGQMGFGTVKREREGATPSILGDGQNESKVLLYFDGPDTLKFMERPNTAHPSFYAMDRISEVPQIPKSK